MRIRVTVLLSIQDALEKVCWVEIRARTHPGALSGSSCGREWKAGVMQACDASVWCTRCASRQFLRAFGWIDGKLEKNNPVLQTLVTVPLSLSRYFCSISTGGISARLHRISLITSEYRCVVYRLIVILMILERENQYITQNLFLELYCLSKHQLN